MYAGHWELNSIIHMQIYNFMLMFLFMYKEHHTAHRICLLHLFSVSDVIPILDGIQAGPC